jgi:hypothetical protein
MGEKEGMNMPFWDQTGDADGSGRGNYFQGEGEYDVEIQAVKHKEKGYRGESVIINVEVISSDNDDAPVGSSKSVAFNLSKQPILALNNLKAFVCGIYGMNGAAKDPETKSRVNHVSKRMVESDNPLARVRVHLSTFMTKTGKGGDFTNLVWSPYVAEPGYVPPFPSANVGAAFSPPTGYVAPGAPPPPPPPAPETYYPAGTAPGRGATHRLVNGAWSPL